MSFRRLSVSLLAQKFLCVKIVDSNALYYINFKWSFLDTFQLLWNFSFFKSFILSFFLRIKVMQKSVFIMFMVCVTYVNEVSLYDV